MADLTLPYPGYNWQLTQHMGMVDSASLSALLEAADLFKGTPDFSQCVSSYMANLSMFSENIRSDSGHSDTWRDYQQILLSSGMPVPFPDGARRLPVVKRILRTWYGRRRDPSPAWARQTAERSHWLVSTSIKTNACTVNTSVRFFEFHSVYQE